MIMESFIALLQALKNFVDISDEEYQLIVPHLRHQRLSFGEDLFKQGDVYSRVAFIVHGLVKKFYLTEKGQEFIKEFSQSGELIAPYSSLIKNKPAMFTLRALEDCELLTVDWQIVQKLFSENKRWMEIGLKLAELQFVNREQREFEFLALSATQRYGALQLRYSNLENRLKKQDIAAYLGITPVSLSRITGRTLRRRSSK